MVTVFEPILHGREEEVAETTQRKVKLPDDTVPSAFALEAVSRANPLPEFWIAARASALFLFRRFFLPWLAFGAIQQHYFLGSLLTQENQGVKYMPAIDKETAFADLIRDHENQWVAIDDRDGVEFIVGSGKDAVEAANDAEAKGFPDALLFKVPSFTSTFVSSTSTVSAAVPN